MKLWTLSIFCAASLLVLSGCGGATPKPKGEAVVDVTLPVVTLTKNGTVAEMKTIAFEWTSIKDPRVEGIYVYKKSPSMHKKENKLEYYETLQSRFTTHYVDTDVVPDQQYSYAFKTFSKDAEGSQSRVIVLNSLPVLESVSWIYSVTGMPRSAKIIWRPHVNQRVESYIIERKTFEEEEWSQIARVDGRLNVEYIDLDLNDNFVYNYRVLVRTYDDIISTPSQSVKVITKALPQGIVDITTTRNSPKQINLTWKASEIEDFAFYCVYRAKSVDGSYDLVAKLQNNKFEDKIDEDGKSYFYRVSVVDKDGLESSHEKLSMQGMTLQRPDAPVVMQANEVDKKIEITWSNADSRSKTFTVVKVYNKNWIDKVSMNFEGIKGHKFVDKDILPSAEYIYTIYGVDSNGIKSEPSAVIKINTAESTELMPTKKEVQVKIRNAPVQERENEEIILPLQDLDLNEI